jgi:hypothetical protein
MAVIMVMIVGMGMIVVMVVAGLPAAACNAHQSTSSSLIRSPSPARSSKSNPPQRGQGV